MDTTTLNDVKQKYAIGTLLYPVLLGVVYPPGEVTDADFYQGEFWYKLDDGSNTRYAESSLKTQQEYDAFVAPDDAPDDTPPVTHDQPNKTLATAAKALAYAWVAPELNRHQATIERLDDPIINAALAAILGGDIALAAVKPGPVMDILNMAAAAIDTIPQYIIQNYKKQTDQTPARLADDIFSSTGKTAVLTIGVNEHFSGQYPPEWQADKTCMSGARVTESPDGVTICKHTAKLWRPRQIDGLYIPACPHCQHGRAWRICQQIEQEGGEYRQGQLGLRILEVGKGGRVKFANKARQHKFRTIKDIGDQIIKKRGLKTREAKAAAREEAAAIFENEKMAVRYLAMPQTGGGAIIVHNMPSWGGEELPGTRPGLFALILDAVKNHDLTLNSSSSNGWGGHFKGTQGNSKPAAEQEQGESETAVFDVTGAPEEQIKLHVKSWGKLAMLLDATQDHNLKAKDRLKLPIVDFVALLDAAGLEYGIVSGSARLKALQGNVTDSIHIPEDPKNICIKSVTSEQNSHPKQQPLPEFGQKPAPIYLNGEWVE